MIATCLLATAMASAATNDSIITDEPSPLPAIELGLNIQKIADIAMNPVLNNQSLIELYQESVEVIDDTDADSVLLQLDPVNNQSKTPPILVMAVYNPSVPSHEDLLNRFRLYFVNITESLPSSAQLNNAIGDLLRTTTPSTWDILRNFIKNQANAIIGAFWIPFNVGAKAMVQSTIEHAQNIHSGSTFGSAISKPIIMKAIDIPNNVAQRVLTLADSTSNAVQTFEQQSKQFSSQTVDAISNGVVNGSEHVYSQYIARPIGAFAGFNLNWMGNTLATLGEHVNNAGIHLNVLGQQWSSGAVKAVDAGATAIAWGLDDSVQLPGKRQSKSDLSEK